MDLARSVARRTRVNAQQYIAAARRSHSASPAPPSRIKRRRKSPLNLNQRRVKSPDSSFPPLYRNEPNTGGNLTKSSLISILSETLSLIVILPILLKVPFATPGTRRATRASQPGEDSSCHRESQEVRLPLNEAQAERVWTTNQQSGWAGPEGPTRNG